jgi:amino acid permease
VEELDIPAGEEEAGAEEDYFAPQRSMPAMVWDEDRPEDHGISSSEATLSLITAMVGSGIMALPQLPVAGGMVVPTVLMIVSTLASMEAGGAFFRALMANNIAVKRGGIKGEGIYIRSWEDFGFAAYGALGAALVRVLTIGFFVGACSGYVILMGQNVQSLLSPFIQLNYRFWVIIIAPLIWLLSMLRDVSAIAKMVPIGVAAAMLSGCLIVVKAMLDSRKWEDWGMTRWEREQLHSMWPTGDVMSLGKLSATIFGAFFCMGNVPSIIDEMKNKHKFKRSFRVGLGSVMLLYIAIMLMGYYAYGNFIQPNIVNSMKFHPATFEESKLPMDQWTGVPSIVFPTAMSCCVLVNLFISYPLLLAPVFISIQRTSYGKKNLRIGSTRNVIMRTMIVSVTIAIPLAIQQFGLAFSLVASMGPVQGVLLPILFGRKIRQKVGARDSSVLRKVWHGALLAISTFCIVFGFVGSVQDIIVSFE